MTALFVPADDCQRVALFSSQGQRELSFLVGEVTDSVDLPELGISMRVDENGLSKQLPFNSKATFLWWHHRQSARDAILVGDAVIVGMPDENGNDTDVPADATGLLAFSGDFVTEVRSGPSEWLRPRTNGVPTGTRWSGAPCCCSYGLLRPRRAS